MFLFCSNMTDAATLAPASPPDAQNGDWARPVAERQLAILERAAEIGLEILEAIGDQAKGGPVVVQADLSMAYNRVLRALRHTSMLQTRLIDWLKDHDAGRVHRKAALTASAARIVRGVIENEEALDAQGAERLATEAAERLRAEDIGDLFSRPFAEAVAAICRDLAVSPDWLELTETCCAAEAAINSKPLTASADDDWNGRYEVQWLPPSSNDSS